MDRYKVIRYFKKAGKKPKTILKNVTFTIAKLHCNSPLTKRSNGDDKDYFDGCVKIGS